MITFPNISKPNYPLKEEIENNSIVSQFEDGSMQSRLKFTRSRTKYYPTWNNLPTEEYNTLKDFIQNQVHYSALTFLWTHPETGTEIEVRITNATDLQLHTVDYWSGSLELTEV